MLKYDLLDFIQAKTVSPDMTRKVYYILFVLLVFAHNMHGKKYIGKGNNGKHFLISTKLGKIFNGSSMLHLHKKKILRTHKSKKSSLKHAKKQWLTKKNTIQEAGNDDAEAGSDYADEGNDLTRYAETLQIGKNPTSFTPISSGKYRI